MKNFVILIAFISTLFWRNCYAQKTYVLGGNIQTDFHTAGGVYVSDYFLHVYFVPNSNIPSHAFFYGIPDSNFSIPSHLLELDTLCNGIVKATYSLFNTKPKSELGGTLTIYAFFDKKDSVYFIDDQIYGKGGEAMFNSSTYALSFNSGAHKTIKFIDLPVITINKQFPFVGSFIENLSDGGNTKLRVNNTNSTSKIIYRSNNYDDIFSINAEGSDTGYYYLNYYVGETHSSGTYANYLYFLVHVVDANLPQFVMPNTILKDTLGIPFLPIASPLTREEYKVVFSKFKNSQVAYTIHCEESLRNSFSISSIPLTDTSDEVIIKVISGPNLFLKLLNAPVVLKVWAEINIGAVNCERILHAFYLTKKTTTSESEFSTPIFKVYPNPATKFIEINGVDPMDYTFKIFAINCDLLECGTVNQNRLDISSLVPGLYWIWIEEKKSGRIYRAKFVKVDL